eukprot:990031-Alexandrium_andersonii.AAC.1
MSLGWVGFAFSEANFTLGVKTTGKWSVLRPALGWLLYARMAGAHLRGANRWSSSAKWAGGQGPLPGGLGEPGE